MELEYGRLYNVCIGKKQMKGRYLGSSSKRYDSGKVHVVLCNTDKEFVLYRFRDFCLQDENLMIETNYVESEHIKSELRTQEVEYLIWLADKKGRTLSGLVNENFKFNLVA